jgi:hypothetical protein
MVSEMLSCEKKLMSEASEMVTLTKCTRHHGFFTHIVDVHKQNGHNASQDEGFGLSSWFSFIVPIMGHTNPKRNGLVQCRKQQFVTINRN